MPRFHYRLIACVFAIVIVSGGIALGAADQEHVTHNPADASQFLTLVAERGLIDGAIPDPRASEHIPSPRPGAVVAESIVSLRKSGEQVGKAIAWSEWYRAGSLEFQEAWSPTGQSAVQYWVLSPADQRCVLTGQAAYGKDGHLLSSSLWRNDPEMLVTGAPDFPGDIFPNLGFPVSAVLRVLSAPRPSATGKLNMMMGPYGYMTFDMWAEGLEQVSVPAGTYKTLKVIMRVDTDSVMQGWPAFMKKLAQPFMPKNVFWFEMTPPHELVKFIGAFGYPAPEVNVEMTRSYVVEESNAPLGTSQHPNSEN